MCVCARARECVCACSEFDSAAPSGSMLPRRRRRRRRRIYITVSGAAGWPEHVQEARRRAGQRRAGGTGERRATDCVGRGEGGDDGINTVPFTTLLSAQTAEW